MTPPFISVRIEDIAQSAMFRRLDQIDGLAIDLRYASLSNFVGRDLYAGFDCAWLHADAATKLAHAVTLLAARAPKRKLVVLDALRPHRVQIALWESLEGTPLTAYLAPPALGSLHSFGMAVDVTLLEADGREVDMGTAFDEMSDRSHPEFEQKHLEAGSLTAAQIENRKCLRETMHEAGFFSITSEWWHFDATANRPHVRATYVRVD